MGILRFALLLYTDIAEQTIDNISKLDKQSNKQVISKLVKEPNKPVKMVTLLVSFLVLLGSAVADYDPTWDSLDTRPLPEWYDKAKVGIFLHWGVFSVPSFGSEWFWFYWKEDKEDYVKFITDNYPPNFTYQDFAKDFTAEFFDPNAWADLFVRSGAKYVVLTTKHHEGYTLWPSKYSFSWNAFDVGPHRDLVGELGDAIKNTSLHFGLYHSLFEWYNPLYDRDRDNNFTTTTFVDKKITPEMKELVNRYEPEILWSDGDGEALDSYWKSTEFLAWLYNESPVKDTVVTNDRWGSNVGCKHGDFFTCVDRYNPGHLLPHKWENAMTIDKKAWGFRREASIEDLLTTHDLIQTLAETVSCGGNLVINVGPTKEGTIAPIFQERLLDLGAWLSINGEAIYETKPWSVQNDTQTPGVWYTSTNSSVYAIALEWPKNNVLRLGAYMHFSFKEVTLLGNDEPLQWELVDEQLYINFTDRAYVKSKWAWVVKIDPAA